MLALVKLLFFPSLFPSRIHSHIESSIVSLATALGTRNINTKESIIKIKRTSFLFPFDKISKEYAIRKSNWYFLIARLKIKTEITNQTTGFPNPIADSSKVSTFETEKRTIITMPVKAAGIILLIHNIIPKMKIANVVKIEYVS